MRAFLFCLALISLGHAEPDPTDEKNENAKNGEETAFTLSGRLHDGNGNGNGKGAGAGQAGVLVQIWDATDPERFLAQGRSGADGRYVIALADETLQARTHPFGPLRLRVHSKRWVFATDVAAGTRDDTWVLLPARKKSGMVRGADKTPLAGIIVRAWAPGRTKPVAEITTIADGSYTLGSLPPGKLALEVHGDNFVHRVQGTGTAVQDIAVPAILERRGRVVDVQEKGVAWAEVRSGERVVAVTEEDGSFVAPVLAGTTPALVVYADGCARAPVTGKAPWVVSVTKAALVRGRIVDEANKSVPDVRVTANDGDGPDLVTWTDERGAYQFSVALHGMITLRAERPGWRPLSLRVDAGRDERMTLSLPRGRVVQGVVKRGEQPAMGVRVRAGDAMAYTDADGAFTINGAPTGALAVVADGSGWRSPAVRLAAGSDPAEVALPLYDRLPIAGRLRNDAGVPLADVAITIGARRVVQTAADGTFNAGRLRIRRVTLRAQPTDHGAVRAEAWPGDTVDLVAESRYGAAALAIAPADPRAPRGETTIVIERNEKPHVRRVASGGPSATFQHLLAGLYTVTVHREGALPTTAQVAVAAQKKTRWQYALEHGGSVRVVSTPGATVVIQTLTGKPSPVRVLELAEGARRLERLGPGTYRFIGRAKGELLVVREAKLGPTTPPTTIDMRGGKAAQLRVTVQDDDGRPVAGARLRVESASGFTWAARKKTGADGTVTLDRLVGGRLEVSAKSDDLEGLDSVVIEPAGEHELTVIVR